jgi:hypothetical protein
VYPHGGGVKDIVCAHGFIHFTATPPGVQKRRRLATLIPRRAVCRAQKRAVRYGVSGENYRALFTIVDANHIARAWLDELHAGQPIMANAPPAWLKWIETGKYAPLRTEPTVEHRTPAEQTAMTPKEAAIVTGPWKSFRVIAKTIPG